MGFPFSLAIRAKVAMAFSVFPVSIWKRALSGSHCVTQKVQLRSNSSWFNFVKHCNTYIAEDNKDRHWYGGQAEQPPPAEVWHYQKPKEDLEQRTNCPECLMHKCINQKGINKQYTSSTLEYSKSQTLKTKPLRYLHHHDADASWLHWEEFWVHRHSERTPNACCKSSNRIISNWAEEAVELTTEEFPQCQTLRGTGGPRASRTLERRNSTDSSRRPRIQQSSDPVQSREIYRKHVSNQINT